MAVDASQTPFYADAASVPMLNKGRLNRLKLAPIRIDQLYNAASRSLNSPPPSPGLGECCGSSCGRECVKSLHYEELKAWAIRWWGEENWKEEWDTYREARDVERERRKMAAREIGIESERGVSNDDNGTVAPKDHIPPLAGTIEW